MSKSKRTAAAAFTIVALVATACGSDATTSEPAGTGSTETSTTSTTTPDTKDPGRGWIGGEPDWRDGNGGAEFSADDDGVVAYEPGAGDGRATEAMEVAAPAPGDAVEPVPAPPTDGAPLRAGSVDDNADYTGFVDYLARLAELGIPLRDFDASMRSIVTVTDADGAPVAGASVEVSGGEDSVLLRTTADGTARLLPGLYGFAAGSTLTYSVDGAEPVAAEVGQDVAIVGSPPATMSQPVPLDVLFLLDATGSMGDEIDRLKTTIDTVAARISQLDPAPDVRFAMTLYRDEGDAFVTATYDFTADVAEFQAALAEVVADGGGDYPEALDEGLADALAEPSWRDPAETVQLVFVVADAPPQVLRQVAVPYTDSIREAVERGIKIFPIASSESDDQAEAVFRQMAMATGAPFVFLSNGAAGASTGEHTDINSTDYEELALDELVVRLVAEELADLDGDGGEVTVPTTVAPPPTNPDGQ